MLRRILFGVTLAIAMPACEGCKPPGRSRGEPAPGPARSFPIDTANPQGPGFLGWTGGENGVYFPGSLAGLPGDAGDSREITAQDGQKYTLTAVALDPCTPRPEALGGQAIPLTLYAVTGPDGGNVCVNQDYTTQRPDSCESGAGPALKERAVVVPGRWSVADGGFEACAAADGGATCFTVSCLTGAVGLCAHWGYVPTFPWPGGGVDLQRHHRACVRAARADYGDGAGYTCRGTYVDVIDGPGIQLQDTHAGFDGSPLELEAAWDEAGAVPFGTSAAPGSCLRARFTGCSAGIDKVLERRASQFRVNESCQPPPPGHTQLRDYFHRDGGVPFVLLTRAWRNEPCGPGCVLGNAAGCPASKRFGPHRCAQDGGAP